jgi:hypothetical protein
MALMIEEMPVNTRFEQVVCPGSATGPHDTVVSPPLMIPRAYMNCP